jgi:transcription initiation factor TFIID subunit TAF12
MRRDFPLHLETSTDIFLPGFKVHVVGKDGLKTHKSYQTKNIVRGYIEGKLK